MLLFLLHVQWQVSENNFDSEAVTCLFEAGENHSNTMHGEFDVRFPLVMMYGGYVAIFLATLQTHPCLEVFMSSMPAAENWQIPFRKWLYMG